jgi:riboflavin biosynthesis pyrimidine reductase
MPPGPRAALWSASVRQLLPHAVAEVDPLDLYLADPREAHDDRPWLMVNMIASLDGATAVDGVSGGLGGPGDKAVFRAVRASCDWVLVASGTAAAENYRMPRTSPELTARRREHGRPPAPNLAIVTASGHVDPGIPALSARSVDDPRPVVIAGTAADRDALAGLDADVIELATERPEPGAALEALGQRGAGVVLAEGGPRFNGILHAAGVIDEFCLSVSPMLVGADSARIIAGGPADPAPMELTRLLEEDGALFARYVRA